MAKYEREFSIKMEPERIYDSATQFLPTVGYTFVSGNKPSTIHFTRGGYLGTLFGFDVVNAKCDLKLSIVPKGDKTDVHIDFGFMTGIILLPRDKKQLNSEVEGFRSVLGGSTKPQPAFEPSEPKVESVNEKPLREPVSIKPEPGITITSAFGYKGATILYTINVRNTTSEPLSDIRVSLFVPDIFMVKENKRSIAMLESNESKTVTFEIRPTGECGDCTISGRVNYYDYSTKRRQYADLETKSLSIVYPLLKVQKTDKSVWKDTVTRLIQAEESTTEIEIPAETLFTMTSRVIEDMNMFMLEPEVTSTPQLFNGVARFYAEGVKALKYAVQIEVVGGTKKSKLILKVWAEKEEALTGFYHGLLDELEKRVQVKGYIDDSIVHQFYQVGTLVKDSVVQRSTIGADPVTRCPNCGRTVSKDEKFCPECGERLK